MRKLVKESLKDKLSGPSTEEILYKMDRIGIENIDKLRDIFSKAVKNHNLDIIEKHIEIMYDLSKNFRISVWQEINIAMSEVVISEDLEMMEILLKHGANINNHFGFGNPPFIETAVRYKINPEMVQLMLMYDDINKENLESIKKILDEKERWAESWQLDKLEKIEDIIVKYNPNYDEIS